MARKTDYLFQRKGSQNWHIKLQYTGVLAEKMGRKKLERSLGTPDRAEAEILAMPMIEQHKRALLEQQRAQDFSTAGPQRRYEPGREHQGPAGERIIATDADLIYLDANGSILKTERNWTWGSLSLPNHRQQVEIVLREEERRRRFPSSKASGDDAIIETYISHANVKGYNAKEARATWDLYKRLTDKLPLKKATRDDGRKVVHYLQAQGLKSATVIKKVGWLNAAVNLAIDETKLQFNPFSRIVPKNDDEDARLPLSESDMKLCHAGLGDLDEEDQLLFLVLASTGMRLSEAFEINEEFEERNCRYAFVGMKSLTSERRVPFPKVLLPRLPKRIQRPLFTGSIPAASKRLNRFLDNCGIDHPDKVVHSLRHRAQDRLRAASCPQDYRWALLGHEKKTVAEGYGEGFPVPLLRKWIDRIGT
ncbi:integrase [Bradyrhizobium diazoefficiens]